VFSASFTDLSVGVQTAASAPFVSVLQEIFTRGRVHLKDLRSTVGRYARRCSSFWQEHLAPTVGPCSKTIVPPQVVGGSVASSVEDFQESFKIHRSS